MNVRIAMLRAVTLLAGAPLLLVTSPAHAATMPTCNGPNATVLADFTLLGAEPFHVAVDSPSASVTVVCLNAANYSANFVFKSNVGLTVPVVNVVNGPGNCGVHIIDMTAPTALSLSVNATTNAVCIGDNGQTMTLVVQTLPGVTAVPDLDIWLPAYSWFQQTGTCLPQYLAAQAGTSPWTLYENCYVYDQQLL